MDKLFVADRVRDTLSFVFPASKLQVRFKQGRLLITGFAPYFDAGLADAKDQITSALMQYMPELLPEITLEVDVVYGYDSHTYQCEE